MNLQSKITEKEQLLERVVNEIETRKKEVEKLTSEMSQLESQGYVIQGAVMAFQELLKETEAEAEAKAKLEASEVKEDSTDAIAPHEFPAM